MKKSFQIQDILLYPLSLLYGSAVWLRNRLFDYKILQSREFTLPLITVGNITAGGTGKTPHVEYLVRLLKDEFKIATLSRGYKRTTSGFFLAQPNSTSAEIGDEPRQIKQKFDDIIVAVDANRVRGIEKLLKIEPDLKAIILDDAFQHRYVMPGLSILLVDYNQPLSHDFLLPYGLLREMPSERLRADIIIVTKCPDNMKPIDQRLLEKELKMYAYQRLFFTTTVYSEPVPVFPESTKPLSFNNLRDLQPHVFLLTGIANNKPLKTYVQGISNVISDIAYPDHYAYTAKDMHELIERFSDVQAKSKCIITTEKDAMRLHQFSDLDEELKACMHYIPVAVSFIENEGKNFDHHITNYVRNNKPDNILHKPVNGKYH